MKPQSLRLAASTALVALILLCLAWELWLAPLRPGGSYLALKALPLVFPLIGILEGKRRTYQWSSMLILGWMAEGVMRGWSDKGLSQALALGEAALAAIFFVVVVLYARATASQPSR